MNMQQAKQTNAGSKIRVRHAAPGMADAYERPNYIPYVGYQYDDIPAGAVVTVQRLIPKVALHTGAPWQDGHEKFFLCEMNPGQRAWVCIGNADTVKE